MHELEFMLKLVSRGINNIRKENTGVLSFETMCKKVKEIAKTNELDLERNTIYFFNLTVKYK